MIEVGESESVGVLRTGNRAIGILLELKPEDNEREIRLNIKGKMFFLNDEKNENLKIKKLVCDETTDDGAGNKTKQRSSTTPTSS